MNIGKEEIELLKRGADESFAVQMALLEKFSGINCGSGNLEGNGKVVSLVDAVLTEMGASIEHVDIGEYGTGIVARIVPENPPVKLF